MHGLTTQLFEGRVHRVIAPNALVVGVDLWFDVSVHKTVYIEGIRHEDTPPDLYAAARHAMVVLLGGKDVYVEVRRPKPHAANVIGRVFLRAKIHGEPAGLYRLERAGQSALEIGTYYHQVLLPSRFDLDVLKQHLNGPAHGAAAYVQ